MKADLSRISHEPERRYRRVLMQQGRVQLDADWNEQASIQQHHESTMATDVIGRCGVPKGEGGFAIAALPGGTDLAISPGRIYVDGTLCELTPSQAAVVDATASAITLAVWPSGHRGFLVGDWILISAPGQPDQIRRVRTVDPEARSVSFNPPLNPASLPGLNGGAGTVSRIESYTTQEDLPGAPNTAAGPGGTPQLDLADGTYLAVLDTWEQHITGLDEPGIIEPALGGPDTTTRTRVVRQVRLIPVPEALADDACEAMWPALGSLLADSSATLEARTDPEVPVDNLCDLPESGGYRRMENQLYRVEVHEPGNGTTATAQFVWSRDNGSVVFGWEGHDEADLNRLILAGPARDAVLAFSSGELVELTDADRELRGEPGTLAVVQSMDANVLTIEGASATGPIDRAQFGRNPRVRRWNASSVQPVERPAEEEGWLDLEDGVQVRFEPGQLRTGDHWLIPARTATGEVIWPRDSLGRPLPKRPDGIEHGYCRLAAITVEAGRVTEVEDCRPTFPTLTEICAEDVCFDNTECEIPDAETVQDALDYLCEHNDNRHHNKMLHGWGVVCGLRIVCGGDDDRVTVRVEPGYALDCEGRDLTLDENRSLPILEMIERLEAENPNEPILTDGAGEVCLRIELDEELRTVVRAERFDPNASESALEGTLLKDFYDECLLPVVEFIREQLTPPPGEENNPTGPTQERLAALTNMLILPVQGQAGYNVFVSRREHEVAEEFYTGLRSLLQSETFCAMFDNARPFPDYPFDEDRVSTIFGRSGHNRLRLRPGAAEAYTFGPGLNPASPSSVINRYGFEKGRMIAQIDPLAGVDDQSTDTGTGAVADVAFSGAGNLIYTIVPSKSGRDTFFRIGDVQAQSINWRPLSTICGVNLVSLAVDPDDRLSVYAVGVAVDGEPNRAGLYRIDTRDVEATPDPIATFNAYGHLEMTEDGVVLATAAAPAEDSTARPESYDRIVLFNVRRNQSAGVITLPTTGTDDITYSQLFAERVQPTVFAVVGRGRSKRIVAYDVRTRQPRVVNNEPFEFTVENSPMCLTVLRGRMLLRTVEDNYSVRAIDLTNNEKVDDTFMPTQVGPCDLAVDENDNVHLINSISNTVQTIPAINFDRRRRFPLAELAEYKAAALEAFADLLGGFTQYAKDCFFAKFMVDCPTCEPDDVVYLGVVSIRDNRVYKACNFSKRKHVMSFPKLGYWLSAVPILPLLGQYISQFACSVLPETFGSYQAPEYQPEQTENLASIKTSTARFGVATVQGADIFGQLQRLTDLPSLAGRTAATQMTSRVATTRRPSGTDIVGRQVPDVERTLGERVSEIEVRPFDGASVPPLGGVTSLVKSVPPNSKVTLYERDGEVLFFDVAGPGDTGVLETRVSELTNRLSERDRQIEQLQQTLTLQETKMVEQETKLAEVSQLAGGIQSIRTELTELRNLSGLTPRPRLDPDSDSEE